MTRQRGGSGGGSCGREGRGGPSARNSPPPPPRRRRCVHCAEADRPTSRPTRRRLTASVRYCGCRSSASVHISKQRTQEQAARAEGVTLCQSVTRAMPLARSLPSLLTDLRADTHCTPRVHVSPSSEGCDCELIPRVCFDLLGGKE